MCALIFIFKKNNCTWQKGRRRGRNERSDEAERERFDEERRICVTEVNEVAGDGIVVLGVDVRNELEKRVLEVARHLSTHGFC